MGECWRKGGCLTGTGMNAKDDALEEVYEFISKQEFFVYLIST